MRLLLGEGAKVMGFDLYPMSGLDGASRGIVGDVTSEASADALVHTAVDRFHAVNAAFNVAILFLASQEACYENGAILLVYGAWAVSGYPDMRSFRGSIGGNRRMTQ